MIRYKTKIISITGTKGKTTIARAIDHVLRVCGENTLRVDTDGHYLNGDQKSTLQDSKDVFMLVPTVCPGRYLLDARKEYGENFVSVFETSLGCSRLVGMGYALHDVGIFTNIYEDHIDSSDRIKSRKDILEAKKFIFTNIRLRGGVVFNADHKLICKALSAVPMKKKPTLIAVSLGENTKLNIKSFLKKGGIYFTIEDDFVVIKTKESTEKLLNIHDVSWTFDGTFKPSLYNLLFTVAGLYAYYKKNKKDLPQEALQALKDYTPDVHGGRITFFKNNEGTTIIVDYAHETQSFLEIALLGKRFVKEGGQLIGVLRISPDRVNNVIKKTSKYIANAYDTFVIYDKLDGIKKKSYLTKHVRRVVGETSKVFSKALKKYKKEGLVERVLIEDDAIKRSSELAKPEDVVIVISGENHKATIASVQKYFKAEPQNT